MLTSGEARGRTCKKSPYALNLKLFQDKSVLFKKKVKNHENYLEKIFYTKRLYCKDNTVTKLEENIYNVCISQNI
jgi:hypothetical protein